MSFFRNKVYILTLFLDFGKNCLGHLASFFMQVCHTCTLLVQANCISEKIFFWNSFIKWFEWSVLGKQTSSKGTHNFTFFVRSWAKQFWASGKKKLGAGLLRLHSTGPVNPLPWEVFLKNVQFYNIFGLRVKHLRSFGKNFLRVMSKLHYFCWKVFLEEKGHVGRKTNCTNISGIWAKKIAILLSSSAVLSKQKPTSAQWFLEER